MPQWRPQIRYQWDLRVSGLGVLTASVSADGVELASDATGETVLLPPGFPLGFGRVLAGLAGGARLRDVPMLASGGLAVTPLSPNGSESPEEIEEFDSSRASLFRWDIVAVRTEAVHVRLWVTRVLTAGRRTRTGWLDELERWRTWVGEPG